MNKIRFNPNMDLSSIVKKLKIEDNRHMRMTKLFQWLMLSMIPIYIYVFILMPSEKYTSMDRLIGLGYGVSFATFSFFFWLKNKDFRNIDYSIPTLQMLHKAAKRYQFKLSKPSSILLIIPVLLIDINTCILFVGRISLCETPLQTVLFVQAFFIPTILISTLAGYLNWRKKQKPLRDFALLLIKEIQNG